MLCDDCTRFCLQVGKLLPVDCDLSTTYMELLRQVQHPDFGSVKLNTPWPSHEMVLFNSLAELKFASQRQCSICRCISQRIPAIEMEELPPGLYQTVLILVPSTGNPCLRVRLEECSCPEKPILVYIENIAMWYHSFTGPAPLAPTVDGCSDVDNDNTGSLASSRLARHWLEDCLENHPRCPKPASGQLPARLLDVRPSDQSVHINLVDSAFLSSLPSHKRAYIALSHCWGKEQILTTTTHTLQDRKSSIATTALTRTFYDAVVATRSLGYRFLWIDSLCIIQDSVEDWETESVKMCAIYQNAVVTIAAVHASNGNEGCFTKRDGLACLPFSIPLRKNGSQTLLAAFFVPLPNSGQSSSRVAPGEPLLRRAWVLQEQVLSRALLMFHDEEMRWECHTMQQSERSPDGALLGRAYANLSRALVANDDPFDHHMPQEEYTRSKSLPNTAEEDFDMHREWCYLVIDYTWRGITNTMDRLIALDGIAQVISQRTRNHYIAGLWRDHLLPGLTWSIPWNHSRNNTFWNQAEDPTTEFFSSRHATALAPSWSWASVTFPVVWFFVGNPAASKMRPLCNIIDAHVDGTPFHLTGSVTIEGQTQRLFVDANYQRYHFSGRSKENPRFKDLGMTGENEPAHQSDMPDICRISTADPGTFSDFPIRFSPDELLQRPEHITFLALAEIPAGRYPSAVESLTMPSILTLALVPTGRKKNEYRRVGLAEWCNCSWYGYFCLGRSNYHHSMSEPFWQTIWRTRWWQYTPQWILQRWKCLFKGLWEKFSNWLVRLICNQPFRQAPRRKRSWFPNLVKGDWGRHHHPANPADPRSYRAGWGAKLETITIV